MERQLRESLKRGKIHGQYVLIGKEPILIDRALNTIKDKLEVREPFDVDYFSLPDAVYEEVIAKLHLVAFQSARRLLVVKDLERVTPSDLEDFAETVNAHRSGNCLVMTYRLEKDKADRKYKEAISRLQKAFPQAPLVTLRADDDTVRSWIRKKVSDNKLPLNGPLVRYLEEEFKDDVTGLRNEFAKIANYLHEVSSLDPNGIRDLAKGLCHCEAYQMADSFIDGRSDTLRIFEELYPFIEDTAFVHVLTRGMLNRARWSGHAVRSDRKALVDLFAQLSSIDRKVKMSSVCTRLSMEMYIMQNAGVVKNGVSHGR
ncbi:hypothetical protein IBX73_07400 [candidate division WOR-3 bacterium]|nr:hypothetical protein [candidate division WOR-3 bacterium]